MKIAVCISGIPRSGIGAKELINQNFHRNRKSHERAFPNADFYYATWSQYENVVKSLFQNDNIVSFEEPVISYHPFYDLPANFSKRFESIIPKYKAVQDARQNRYKHQTKQILAHAYLLDYFSIQKHYDVIIRCRYDTYIYSKANFEKMLEAALTNKQTTGFATLGWTKFDSIKKMPKNNVNSERFIFDSLIMHSNEVFNTKEVYKLNEEKMLYPCEFGWYQTMSMPYGNNHVCYSGWANADRALKQGDIR